MQPAFKKTYKCGDIAVFKKRWFDGLQDIYEGKDEFEIKFGCFGGDGGPAGGDTTTTTNAKGEEMQESKAESGFRGEQSAAAANAAAALGKSQSSSGLNTSMESMSIDDAFGKKAQAPAAQQVSVTSPAVTSGIQSMFDMAPTMTAPTNPSQAQAQAKAPAFSGLSIGPGQLTGSIAPGSISVGYSMPFAKGGAVHQGIGSIFPSKR